MVCDFQLRALGVCVCVWIVIQADPRQTDAAVPLYCTTIVSGRVGLIPASIFGLCALQSTHTYCREAKQKKIPWIVCTLRSRRLPRRRHRWSERWKMPECVHGKKTQPTACGGQPHRNRKNIKMNGNMSFAIILITNKTPRWRGNKEGRQTKGS